MVLDIQSAHSTFFQLERICKNIWPCTTLHCDKSQFHHSSVPEWLLIGYHGGQKGLSFFSGKVDFFHQYPVSLRVLHLLCWNLPDIKFFISISSFLSSLLFISLYMRYIFWNMNQASLGSLFFPFWWLRPKTFIMHVLVFRFFPSAYSFYLFTHLFTLQTNLCVDLG